MKLKFAIVSALVLIISAVKGADKAPSPSLSISTQETSGIYLINYKGSKTGTVKMTIKDSKGKLLTSENIKGFKDFAKPVNFTGVGEGEYTIEVDNGSDKQIQNVSYFQPTSTTYTHVISLGDNRYMLTASNDGTEKINIRIFDGSNTIIFEENNSVTGNFSKVFKLKSIHGTPRFDVTDLSDRSIVKTY